MVSTGEAATMIPKFGSCIYFDLGVVGWLVLTKRLMGYDPSRTVVIEECKRPKVVKRSKGQKECVLCFETKESGKNERKKTFLSIYCTKDCTHRSLPDV